MPPSITSICPLSESLFTTAGLVAPAMSFKSLVCDEDLIFRKQFDMVLSVLRFIQKIQQRWASFHNNLSKTSVQHVLILLHHFGKVCFPTVMLLTIMHCFCPSFFSLIQPFFSALWCLSEIYYFHSETSQISAAMAISLSTVFCVYESVFSCSVCNIGAAVQAVTHLDFGMSTDWPDQWSVLIVKEPVASNSIVS